MNPLKSLPRVSSYSGLIGGKGSASELSNDLEEDHSQNIPISYPQHDCGSLNLLNSCMVQQYQSGGGSGQDYYYRKNVTSATHELSKKSERLYRRTSSSSIDMPSLSQVRKSSSILSTSTSNHSMDLSSIIRKSSSSLVSGHGTNYRSEAPSKNEEFVTTIDENVVKSVVLSGEAWGKVRETIRAQRLVTSLGVTEACLEVFKEEAEKLKKKKIEEATRAEAEASGITRVMKRFSFTRKPSGSGRGLL